MYIVLNTRSLWLAGKDVLQQPLEQSIASLDAEWGTKVNDDEDWAEKAAMEKRKHLLKVKEVCVCLCVYLCFHVRIHETSKLMQRSLAGTKPVVLAKVVSSLSHQRWQTLFFKCNKEDYLSNA